MNKITPAVRILIILNTALFLINSVTLYDLNDLLGLYLPANDNYAIWQYITSMFMHHGVVHILFNMVGLYFFGCSLERTLGSQRFVFLYFITGIGAGIIYTLVHNYEYSSSIAAVNAVGMFENEINELLETRRYIPIDGLTEAMVGNLYQNYHIQMTGASGALYGIIVAFAMCFPNAKMSFIFIPFPIAAKYFVPGLLCVDLTLQLTGLSPFGGFQIAHSAHLGGALTGFLMMLFWRFSR